MPSSTATMSIFPVHKLARSRLAVATAAWLLVMTSTAAQSTAPAKPSAPAAQPSKTTPPAPPPTPPATPPRPPAAQPAPPTTPAPTGKLVNPRLMREGSFLVQVKGRLVRDDATGWWRFIVQDDRPQIAGQSFRMLPNTRLGEMERMAESMADSQVLFELTGEVFAYQGRNYLLATHSPLVSVDPAAAIAEAESKATAAATGAGRLSDQRQSARSPGPPSPTRTPATPAPANAAPQTQTEDSAEDIVAELEQAVGPLARSIDLPAEQQQDQVATMMREGTMITARRGHMMRDRSGVWLFVFDADASGQNDPPMMLVPCALLERMRQYTTQSTTKAAMLVSGRVFAYRSRNYLLPTVFRIPSERTPLTP